MTPDELLERLADELRGTVGPAVDEPFARTQAFMGAVILERLSRQLRSADGHAEAARADHGALVADLRSRLGPAPPARTAAAVDLAAGTAADAVGDAAQCEIVAALWADRVELGEQRFDDLLATVRRALRARLDRELEYSRVSAPDSTPTEAAIRVHLAERLEAPDLVLDGVERIAVGWSHETWLFDASWSVDGERRTQALCLRRDPGSTLLRELSDLSTQHRVLECLQDTPVPTPRPFWYEADPAVLGGPFVVMEKVPGTCPSPWGSAGRAFYAAAAERGRLPESFTDTLVGLHTVDWRAAGLDFLGVPGPGDDFGRRELAKWQTLIDASGLEPHPVLVDLTCWLEANVPSTDRLVLVHGAYRTGNLLVQDDEVSAVLDWETEVIGDPMYDVAYVLSDLNREGTDLLSNLVDRDDFYRRYEAGTGFSIDEERCRWYELLYAMRSAAFWMSASGLFADGRSSDLRLARTAWSIPVVLDTAARRLGY